MIKGINHIGISVTDLRRSIAFYRDVIGLEVLLEAPFEGERYVKLLALTGTKGRAALLGRSDFQVELFEFSSPIPRVLDPNHPVSDLGISHFCVEVTDIDYEYARLVGAGVPFHCPPVDFSGSAKAAYCRDPDGNVIELWEKTAAAFETRDTSRVSP